MPLKLAAQSISCPDLKIVEADGKKTCQHYLGHNLCDLPRNFICRPSLSHTPFNLPNSSFSQLSLFSQCRRKYHYTYRLKIQPQKVPSYFIQGRIFHERMANYYRTGSMGHITKLETENDILAETMADLYIEHYKDSHFLSRDQNYEIEIPEIIDLGSPRPYKFVIDMYDPAKKEVTDHKLAGQVQPFLITAFQGVIYLLAKPEAEKFTVNVTIKSQVKRTGNMDLHDYAMKIKESVLSKPSKHFIRITYYRDEILSRFKKESSAIELHLNEALKHIDDLDWFYMNPSACSMLECEFQNICDTGAVSSKLYKFKQEKHDVSV